MAKTIMIVGSDARARNDLATRLTRQELWVWAVPDSGSGALPAYLTQADLIVLDVPPSETGDWRLLRQIRGLSMAPVIALVATDEHQIKVEGLDRGADYVMTKPVDTRELEARIGALIRRARSQVSFKPTRSVRPDRVRVHR